MKKFEFVNLLKGSSFILLWMLCLNLFAQDITIKGTIKDADNEPIIGATIVEQGNSAHGTVTDIDGNYILNNVPPNAILQITYVGMKSMTIPVNGRTTVNITMESETELLDEVVVVGYGTQRKANLTGAVGSVTADELTSRIAPSTSSLLQGRSPGLQITQNSAMPGNEKIEIQIRGMGTFSSAGNNPLILIDGVEGDMNKLNPNMIENISILKDAASAAIYGSRAANGVILVTTKSGKEGQLAVEYFFNYSVQKPTKPMSRVTNSVEYMELINKAIDFSGNVNVGWRYTDEEINRYKAGQDPNDPSYNPAQYPNSDWLDYLIREAPIEQHFININGGKNGTTFNAGLGLMDQTGLLLGTSYKKYDVQFNLKSELTKRVTFGTNISMNYGILHDTAFNDTDIGTMNASRDQMRSAYAASPLMTPQLPDGSGRWSSYAYENKGGNKNPIAVAEAGGGQLQDINYILASSFLNVKIIENLTAEIKGAVKFDESQNKVMKATWDGAVFLPEDNGDYKDLPSTSLQAFTQRNNRSKQYTLYGTLNYSKAFNDVHYLNAMTGYSMENYKYEEIEGYRRGYTVTDMWYLSMGPTPSQTNNSSVNDWSLMSYFGRINYDFKHKYLFEANVRYDGTSRLPDVGRWGIFPSISAGWRITEEPFMNNLSYIDNLKFRTSLGQLGNQNIGSYPYQAILSSSGYNFGGIMSNGYYSNTMVNNNIKWETTTSSNFGLDFNLLQNKLFGSIDWYHKYTTNILRRLQVPSFVGINGPMVNQGEMKNVGWEFLLGYQNRIGDFHYSIKANLDTYKNTLVKYGADEISGVNIRREGLPWNSYYVLIQDGVYQNQKEIDEETFNDKPVVRKYAGSVQIKPGDIRYKDLSGPDGIPDGVIDANYDRAPVEGSFPKFGYGLNIDLSYKIFDLSCFFQGIQGRKMYVASWGISPFNQASAPPVFWKDAWNGEGTSNYIPHIYMDGYGPMQSGNSSFFLRDASYFRMKSIQLGLNIPQKITQRMLISNARIYFSGDNLLTFTKFFNGQIDPERTGQGSSDALYPQAKIYTAGIRVTF